MPRRTLPTIAILNSNEDVLDIMSRFLKAEGFVTATLNLVHVKSGEVEICSFFEKHNPQVIVYGIAFPYLENLRQWQNLKQIKGCADRDFILTTPNLDALKDAANHNIDAFQLVDEHTDLRNVISAVKEMWAQKANSKTGEEVN